MRIFAPWLAVPVDNLHTPSLLLFFQSGHFSTKNPITDRFAPLRPPKRIETSAHCRLVGSSHFSLPPSFSFPPPTITSSGISVEGRSQQSPPTTMGLTFFFPFILIFPLKLRRNHKGTTLSFFADPPFLLAQRMCPQSPPERVFKKVSTFPTFRGHVSQEAPFA